MDVRELTMEKLNEMLHKAWGASLDDVYHIHASPDCRTLSTADGSKIGIKEGRSHYRKFDGTPNTSAPQYRQQRVKDADEAMNHVLAMFVKLAQRHPIMLLTVENPKGFFAEQPMVKSMLKSPQHWRLLEGNYCKAADPRYDGDKLWSMKPTHFLIRGGQPDLQLPKCNFDCKFRIDDSNRHKVSIRIDRSSDPQQVKLEGHHRHAIPGGLLDVIHTSHEQSVKELETDMQQTPAGIFACIDESHESKCIMETCTNEHMLLYNFDRDSLIATNKATREAALEKKWQLIHARYGHQNKERIGKKKIKGLRKTACPVCMASKACRKPHKGSISRGKYAMHLVHTDVQEFSIPDIDGYKYQAVFVDDYTDRQWTYLLKNKSDYSEIFRLWLSEVGVAPTRIRSDWGGEFLAAMQGGFLKICLERGIWAEKSVPYVPQQNGKAEKANRTLLEMTRSMLLHANLPKEYWGYAVR